MILTLKTFCETFKLKHLVKVPTCFKNLINPKCIDIILTNKVHNFQNTATVETGLSDHHKLTVTVLKNVIPQIAPKIIKFRNLVNLDDAGFKKELADRLTKYALEYEVNNTYEVNNGNISYKIFHNIFMGLTNKYAPIKGGNHAPFMSKLLTQNISHRTKLRNRFLKYPSNFNKSAYKIQRNKCVRILRRENSRYYGNLNQKHYLR